MHAISRFGSIYGYIYLSHRTVRSPWFDQSPAVLGGMMLALITLLARLGGIDIDINPAQKCVHIGQNTY